MNIRFGSSKLVGQWNNSQNEDILFAQK